MNKQFTNTILMISPIAFKPNEQTAINNYYQREIAVKDKYEIQKLALKEFQLFTKKLRSKGIVVLEIKDRINYNTPDSIFPNNWISSHADGRVVLYPMFAENRRRERRDDIFDLFSKNDFLVSEKIDYTHFELQKKYLEGTGSLVLDRVNKKAYCALSPRSYRDLLDLFCKDFGYTPVPFTAYHNVKDKPKPIYHTNVMMCIADKYAVICLDSITDPRQRKRLRQTLENDGKEVIPINEYQVNKFAGNMLQVANANGVQFLVMSSASFYSLDDKQKDKIKKYNDIIHSDLKTIEFCGGGSARCMVAEIFLPKKKKI